MDCRVTDDTDSIVGLYKSLVLADTDSAEVGGGVSVEECLWRSVCGGASGEELVEQSAEEVSCSNPRLQYTFSTLNGDTIDPSRRLVLDLWRRNVSYPVEQPGRWVCSCFASIHLGISLPGSI